MTDRDFSYERRRWTNRIMLGLCISSAAIGVGVLLMILGYILYHGFSTLSLDLLTKSAKPIGETGGGLHNEIIGTLVLLGLATGIGLPIGLMTGVFLAEFGGPKATTVIRFTADVLTGLPSIVVGVFAYAIVVRPMHHASAFAGGIALAIIMIPIIARTAEESLRLVPNSVREAALALGIPRWRTVLSVVIPGASAGIITGSLLAMARVAGETAPLIFTIGNNKFGFDGIFEWTTSMPTSIYYNAQSPYESDRQLALAASVILVLMVFVTSLLVRLVASRRQM